MCDQCTECAICGNWVKVEDIAPDLHVVTRGANHIECDLGCPSEDPHISVFVERFQ